LASAKSWALLDGRDHVVPEDIQAVLPGVVEHRLRENGDFSDYTGTALAQRLLNRVDIIG